MPIEITPTEERAIISFALDEPVFFANLIDKMSSDFFVLDEAQYVFKIIKFCYDNKGEIPSRALVKDLVEKTLSVDNDEFREILEICDHKVSPRDYDVIKDRVITWLRSRTLSSIYDDDVIESTRAGDYSKVEDILDRASQLQDLTGDYMWFFDELPILFEKNTEVKYTTEFSELDRYINDGGPTKGDVLIWMAPTGVGKSIAICNNAAACVKMGLNVLHVT